MSTRSPSAAARHRGTRPGGGAALLWLLLFFVVPFVIVLKISFSEVDLAIPPYKPLWQWTGKNRSRQVQPQQLRIPVHRLAVRDGAAQFAEGGVHLDAAVPGDRLPDGLRHRARPAGARNILLLLVILPFWTSMLLRVYAWIGLLKANGLINNCSVGSESSMNR